MPPVSAGAYTGFGGRPLKRGRRLRDSGVAVNVIDATKKRDPMTHPMVDERTAWIRRCALRLGRLRPELDPMLAYLLADDLYDEGLAPDQAAVRLAQDGPRGARGHTGAEA
jgi:hypothetical protein